MQEQQARSIEIDVQSPQDQQALRHTGGRPRASLLARARAHLCFRGKSTRPSFYLPSRRLRPGTSRMMNSNGVLSLSVSPVVRTRILLDHFVTNLSRTSKMPLKSCAKMAVTHSGTGFRCSTNNPLAVRQSADVFVRQARAFDERQMGKRLPPPLPDCRTRGKFPMA